MTRIWNQTRPWGKWRYRESKMRRCHRGPRDLGQGRTSGRGAEGSGAAGYEEEGCPGWERVRRGADRPRAETRVGFGQGMPRSGGLRGRWARCRPRVALAERPGPIGPGGMAGCPTWSRSLGALHPVRTVVSLRFGPTFWLRLRPNSRRVRSRREL